MSRIGQWRRVKTELALGHEGEGRIVVCPCGERLASGAEEGRFSCECGRQFRQYLTAEVLVTSEFPIKADAESELIRLRRQLLAAKQKLAALRES